MLPAERAAELAQGPVTIDIDATGVEVYGNENQRKKKFVKRCRRVSGAIANGLCELGFLLRLVPGVPGFGS